MISTPSAQEQLDFLTKIQRLFNESDFSSTYKYALLISLADLAVELGKDDNSPLELTNRQIAERFIELYWQQTTPYKTSEANQSGILFQNNGSQAAIIKAIHDFRQQNNCNTSESAQLVSQEPQFVLIHLNKNAPEYSLYGDPRPQIAAFPGREILSRSGEQGF